MIPGFHEQINIVLLKRIFHLFWYLEMNRIFFAINMKHLKSERFCCFVFCRPDEYLIWKKKKSQYLVTIGVDVMWMDVGVQLFRSRHAIHMGCSSAAVIASHRFSL